MIAAVDAPSAPPSTFALIVWLAMFLVAAWGCISGWLAKEVHRQWEGTWLLPGVMSDLPTLNRIYRWSVSFFFS